MLLIIEAFQGGGAPRQGGVGPRRVCRYAAGDCVEPVSAALRARLNDRCVGRPRCSVAVDVGSWLHSCNRFADYTHVVYQCIPSWFRLTVCYTVHSARRDATKLSS